VWHPSRDTPRNAKPAVTATPTTARTLRLPFPSETLWTAAAGTLVSSTGLTAAELADVFAAAGLPSPARLLEEVPPGRSDAGGAAWCRSEFLLDVRGDLDGAADLDALPRRAGHLAPRWPGLSPLCPECDMVQLERICTCCFELVRTPAPDVGGARGRYTVCSPCLAYATSSDGCAPTVEEQGLWANENGGVWYGSCWDCGVTVLSRGDRAAAVLCVDHDYRGDETPHMAARPACESCMRPRPKGTTLTGGHGRFCGVCDPVGDRDDCDCVRCLGKPVRHRLVGLLMCGAPMEVVAAAVGLSKRKVERMCVQVAPWRPWDALATEVLALEDEVASVPALNLCGVCGEDAPKRRVTCGDACRRTLNELRPLLRRRIQDVETLRASAAWHAAKDVWVRRLPVVRDLPAAALLEVVAADAG
jgi:predicted nucleic acid-binding Zn ribbon protein